MLKVLVIFCGSLDIMSTEYLPMKRIDGFMGRGKSKQFLGRLPMR